MTTSEADARAKKLNDRVVRYLDMLQTEDLSQMEHALDKLELVEMTLDCLTYTKCGRIVNRLIKDPEVGGRVARLVQKWRTIATEEGIANKQRVIQVKYEQSESPNSVENDSLEDIKPLQMKVTKRSAPLNDFEAQLLQADKPVSKKKKKSSDTRQHVPDAEDVQQALLDSIGQSSSSGLRPQTSGAIAANTEESFDLSSIKRTGRTKIYAGRRKAPTGITEVPPLLQLCQRFMQEHIDQLDELGNVPYNLLEGVFERCTTEQLERISEKNPHLHEDMNQLWRRHIKKSFNVDEKKKRDVTWYQCYKRLCRDREEKLKVISAKINRRSEQAAAPILRTTLISEIINPMRMQKKQIRNGIAPTSTLVAGAKEISHARREIFNSGSKAAFNKLPNASTTKGSVLAKSSSSKVVAPKRGALMSKAIKMLKSQRR